MMEDLTKIKKVLCPRCKKNTARRQMCGKCGKINILPCSDCRSRVEACVHCGAVLI